jgi:hypothetical protein
VSQANAARIYGDLAALNSLVRPAGITLAPTHQSATPIAAPTLFYRTPQGQLVNTSQLNAAAAASQSVLAQIAQLTANTGIINPLNLQLNNQRFNAIRPNLNTTTPTNTTQQQQQQVQNQLQQHQINLQNTINLQNHLASLAAFGRHQQPQVQPTQQLQQQQQFQASTQQQQQNSALVAAIAANQRSLGSSGLTLPAGFTLVL